MTHALHDLLRTSALRYARRTAVVDPAKNCTITYSELASRASAVAAVLVRNGLQPGDRVGVCAPKSVGTVTTMFGILEAEGAYVPVDADAPAQRSAGIFEDCAVRMIVVERPLADKLRPALKAAANEILAELDGDLVLLRGFEPEPAIHAAAKPGNGNGDNLAYILYTSGSTGKPKGVVHTHASALSFVKWCSDTFAPTPEDRFSSHAPFHFDLSILDLYLPVAHGATLVLIDEPTGKQPLKLAPVIAEQRISIWYSTPSILRLLGEFGRMERYDYSALRLVLFAGEVFPVKHLRTLTEKWPKPRYFNLYGPTETNVCTYYEVPQAIEPDRTIPYPIGWTCSNDRTRVIDEKDNDVVPGEAGELIVSGGTVMQGYWNLRERTDTAFLVDSDANRWYRTGDVVRDIGGGCYDYLGRRDRMVKRRGYRVELGEIEAALYRHPLVEQVAVLASPDEENGVRLDAFLVGSAGSRFSILELKKFCAANLPVYMVPDRFLFRHDLPQTSTGKVDYQRLRASV